MFSLLERPEFYARTPVKQFVLDVERVPMSADMVQAIGRLAQGGVLHLADLAQVVLSLGDDIPLLEWIKGVNLFPNSLSFQDRQAIGAFHILGMQCNNGVSFMKATDIQKLLPQLVSSSQAHLTEAVKGTLDIRRISTIAYHLLCGCADKNNGRPDGWIAGASEMAKAKISAESEVWHRLWDADPHAITTLWSGTRHGEFLCPTQVHLLAKTSAFYVREVDEMFV